ncbi:hypothetical protein EJB05_07312 [Eragrostis curvula]|uniref:Uncharacterized protein n=1 Tax=Eragrostis curvula TaxID=38414 RepID=A0A5J9WIB6_9POAL|nr:hypothetical protein EJB05_07312 [Eragrostis curvula]
MRTWLCPRTGCIGKRFSRGQPLICTRRRSGNAHSPSPRRDSSFGSPNNASNLSRGNSTISSTTLPPSSGPPISLVSPLHPLRLSVSRQGRCCTQAVAGAERHLPEVGRRTGRPRHDAQLGEEPELDHLEPRRVRVGHELLDVGRVDHQLPEALLHAAELRRVLRGQQRQRARAFQLAQVERPGAHRRREPRQPLHVAGVVQPYAERRHGWRAAAALEVVDDRRDVVVGHGDDARSEHLQDPQLPEPRDQPRRYGDLDVVVVAQVEVLELAQVAQLHRQREDPVLQADQAADLHGKGVRDAGVLEVQVRELREVLDRLQHPPRQRPVALEHQRRRLRVEERAAHLRRRVLDAVVHQRHAPRVAPQHLLARGLPEPGARADQPLAGREPERRVADDVVEPDVRVGREHVVAVVVALLQQARGLEDGDHRVTEPDSLVHIGELREQAEPDPALHQLVLGDVVVFRPERNCQEAFPRHNFTRACVPLSEPGVLKSCEALRVSRTSAHSPTVLFFDMARPTCGNLRVTVYGVVANTGLKQAPCILLVQAVHLDLLAAAQVGAHRLAPGRHHDLPHLAGHHAERLRDADPLQVEALPHAVQQQEEALVPQEAQDARGLRLLRGRVAEPEHGHDLPLQLRHRAVPGRRDEQDVVEARDAAADLAHQLEHRGLADAAGAPDAERGVRVAEEAERLVEVGPHEPGLRGEVQVLGVAEQGRRRLRRGERGLEERRALLPERAHRLELLLRLGRHGARGEEEVVHQADHVEVPAGVVPRPDGRHLVLRLLHAPQPRADRIRRRRHRVVAQQLRVQPQQGLHRVGQLFDALVRVGQRLPPLAEEQHQQRAAEGERAEHGRQLQLHSSGSDQQPKISGSGVLRPPVRGSAARRRS